ncbi:hypothetical protein HK101_001441 [Irineochytrium annulatum]|nr:hypothetical protein HK101_001441 [Irineochytrium annulatum]
MVKATVIKNGAQVFGQVVGTKMQRTIKPVIYHKTYFAHDEEEKCVVGDWVRIDACMRLSKNKTFTLGEIVRAAARYTDGETGKTHSQAAGEVKVKMPDEYTVEGMAPGLLDRKKVKAKVDRDGLYGWGPRDGLK